MDDFKKFKLYQNLFLTTVIILISCFGYIYYSIYYHTSNIIIDYIVLSIFFIDIILMVYFTLKFKPYLDENSNNEVISSEKKKEINSNINQNLKFWKIFIAITFIIIIIRIIIKFISLQ